MKYLSQFDGKPMDDECIARHKTWHPASGHKSGWRIVRQFFDGSRDGYLEEARGKTGRLRLFRTYNRAKLASERLELRERLKTVSNIEGARWKS